jgi:ABC-type nitrate/sulfonate/bicarbonate transport system permease component
MSKLNIISGIIAIVFTSGVFTVFYDLIYNRAELFHLVSIAIFASIVVGVLILAFDFFQKFLKPYVK